jgi:hypothetical protein
MVGYSEVLQTMAAMVLFSVILLTANKIIFLNSQQEVESRAEQRAVTIAQSIIDEARTLPFDAETVSGPPSEIPDGFSDSGPGASDTTRAAFNDFDDYHGWSEKIDWIPGSGDESFNVDVQVLYVSGPDYSMTNGSTTNYTEFKKMVVTVTSNYLTDNQGNNIKVQIPYLRRYYKQE